MGSEFSLTALYGASIAVVPSRRHEREQGQRKEAGMAVLIVCLLALVVIGSLARRVHLAPHGREAVLAQGGDYEGQS